MSRAVALVLSLVFAAGFAAVPALAQVADPVAPVEGFSGGFIRPFSGFSHLFALIAVGLIAAQIGGRALWEVPLAFLGAMLVGYVLAMVRIPLPFAALVTTASVVIFGLLIALRRNLSANYTLILVGLFGLFHGNAQGVLVRQADALSTGLGFGIAATLIYAAVVIAAVALLKAFARERSGRYLGWTGWVIAAIGLVLFFV